MICSKTSLTIIAVTTALLVAVSLAMALEVGDKAPDFTLPSTMGDKVSLSQFKGKKNVLIEFFIAAASRTGT